ncbi:sphingosine-1-phosphate phosphatase 1-like [Condylostylus longicornis]|uniref:sphingosine-1-phosphate phosphatase 1-like n=1 Tax=Condylostylus longicornis TaxID=2530218 RepID=UPI00244DAC5A|nr:sphingosine-1-phosphate phosphatase 1-like [Condylostylus longicornis]
MTNFVDFLKSPELVIRVQEFFGIKYVHRKRKRATSETNEENSETESVSLSPSPNGNLKKYEDEISEQKKIIIQNKFWYYIFLLGTELGDEAFYATFIPFWFWNIDGAVGRRVVLLWSSIMYVGQSLKDIIRWERPGFPVIRLQKKWSIEYGMPSTHAMVGFSIPFSVLIFTHQRYQYNFVFGIVIAVLWCTVVCLSRIYLGMHSVCDVVVGLLLTMVLMTVFVPLIDYADFFIISWKYSPLFLLFISIMIIVYYPISDKWTPTRGDTTTVVSVTIGILIGAWINYQLGNMIPLKSSPPYKIIWPTYTMLGLLLLRTILGMCCIVATIAIGKSISYAIVCAILGKDKNKLLNSENHLNNKDKIFVELCYKYLTYGLVGLSTQYLLPSAFKLLGIERPNFYTEI